MGWKRTRRSRLEGEPWARRWQEEEKQLQEVRGKAATRPIKRQTRNKSWQKVNWTVKPRLKRATLLRVPGTSCPLREVHTRLRCLVFLFLPPWNTSSLLFPFFFPLAFHSLRFPSSAICPCPLRRPGLRGSTILGNYEVHYRREISINPGKKL